MTEPPALDSPDDRADPTSDRAPRRPAGPGEPTTIALDLDARLEEIRRVSEVLDAFAATRGIGDSGLFGVKLAVDELLTNTISYGYGDGRAGTIHCRFGFHAQGITAFIADDADPFDPFAAPAPDLDADIEDRPIGGLGIHFVRTFASAFRYSRDRGRNVVELEFATPVRDADHADDIEDDKTALGGIR